jgi:protein-S-isoprenylcysteine O-methyltransferase Ste14
MSEQNDLTRGVFKRAAQVALGGLILGVVLFASAGSLDWWQAWTYIAIYYGAVAFNALFVLRDDRELIAERGETKENTKGWDRVVTNAITVATLLTLFVAGLDVRFGWGTVPLAVSATGFVFIVLGFAVVSRAMAANRFFSRVARIQDERGQEVCSSGPYRFVRHPGYVGTITYSLATPFALGSWRAVVPALLVAIGFVIRTALEDRMLRAELPGYAGYAERVRNRLVPGIW